VSEAPEGLSITYAPEGLEGLGELRVAARANPFAGATVGYVNNDDLLAWTRALDRYPWPDDERPQISSGLGDRETLNLTAFTVTRRGQLAIAVHVATVDIDGGSPTVGTVSESRLLVLTSYEAVRRFAKNLAEAVAKGGGAAQLDVEVLA
jgi:hypothetical protein